MSRKFSELKRKKKKRIVTLYALEKGIGIFESKNVKNYNKKKKEFVNVIFEEKLKTIKNVTKLYNNINYLVIPY